LPGLRVRIKELAQEARFIRHEEERIKKHHKIDGNGNDLKSRHFWMLRHHRKVDVGQAARAAQLAYGFLRGVPYRKIESKTDIGYLESRLLKEVRRLATKFSPNGITDYNSEIAEWFAKPLDE
jgi:hypothetical protein